MRRNCQRESLRREQLSISEQLCSGDDQGPLGRVLRTSFPTLSRAFVVRCMPEQTEDIYWLLIPSNNIVMVDVPRGPESEKKPLVVLLMDLERFRRKKLARPTRDRLEVALELLREDRHMISSRLAVTG